MPTLFFGPCIGKCHCYLNTTSFIFLSGSPFSIVANVRCFFVVTVYTRVIMSSRMLSEIDCIHGMVLELNLAES